MIRVAAYCRVSTDKEDQANSFEAQQRFFREYIGNQPQWELWDIYADEGISGTSTKKRAEFNRMIHDACAGKFSLILTKEISRFSRNILDTIEYTRRLKAMGVGVQFLTENLNTMNPESEMLMTFMGVLAQEESRRTSVRVKWGQQRQMERGVVFGRSLMGYRVSGGQMTVVPEEAELVRLIFQKYGIEQKGTRRIARELQEAGYRTSTGNPNWSSSHIIKILKNEKYVGDLIQKKSITPDYLTHAKRTNHGQEEMVVLPSHHRPIISRELWDTVQRTLSARSPGAGEGHSNRYLFSGRIRCGECGAVFVGRQKKRSGGTILRRWACGRAIAGGRDACSVGHLVRDDDARQMLATALGNLRLDRDVLIDQMTALVLEVIRPCTAPENTPQLQRQCDALQRKLEKILDAYFEGDITKEEMLSARARCDRRLSELRARLEGAHGSDIDEEVIRRNLDELLSSEDIADGLGRTILESLTVFRDRHLELRLKELPMVFRFQHQ